MAFRLSCVMQDLGRDIVTLLQATALAILLVAPILTAVWFYGQTF